jgi:hypothetical protein
MDGCYWSHEACGWVRSPAADALSTPWSSGGVPVPAPPRVLRDGWDVIGWFPPLPGLPAARQPAGDSERDGTRT